MVDFLQMILKIIIQNLHTSNTSVSQNNNQRLHRKTFRIYEQENSLWGWVFFQSHSQSPHCFVRRKDRGLWERDWVFFQNENT